MQDIKIYSLYASGMLYMPFSSREISGHIKLMLNIINASCQILTNIDLYLVDDHMQAKLNYKYLSCMGPTNIISFPLGKTGILSLSLDTFQRECLLYGQEPTEHFLRLLAHGIGHLAGYDHGIEMESLCDSCIEAVMKNSGLHV